MNLRYVKVADAYIAVDEQEAVVGVLKLLPLQSYYQEIKPLKTANRSPTDVYLMQKIDSLQKEVEELKQNRPMTAAQHLAIMDFKTHADAVRRVYQEACDTGK